jgi:hypothetical protein
LIRDSWRNILAPSTDARDFLFAARHSRVRVCAGSVTGDATMTLARPFHILMVCAAFLFIGAIVLGAI